MPRLLVLTILLLASPAQAATRPAGPRLAATGPVTVVLILDRSGSMSGAPIAGVRAAATAVVDRLRPTDHLAVVTFDSRPTLVVPIAAVGNRTAARAAVARIDAAGGTDLTPALGMAADQLARAPAGPRLVIVLGDGQMPLQGLDAAIRRVVALRAVVSTIALGSSADVKTLGRMAADGQGRAHRISDPARIRAVCLEELKRLGR